MIPFSSAKPAWLKSEMDQPSNPRSPVEKTNINAAPGLPGGR